MTIKNREEKEKRLVNREYGPEVLESLPMQVKEYASQIRSPRKRGTIHPLDDCDYFYGGPG